MSKILKAGLLGAVVLFVWGYVSWMVLPWHKTTMHTFKDSTAVSQTIKANADVSGMYFLTNMEEKEKTATTTGTSSNATATEKSSEPSMFASVRLEGSSHDNMTQSLVKCFITQLLAALLVSWLLLRTNGLSYFKRVIFIVVFALAAGIIANVPNWNWFGFDTQYTLVEFADLLIGWFLAGLIMAKICKNRQY